MLKEEKHWPAESVMMLFSNPLGSYQGERRPEEEKAMKMVAVQI
jgi:hypothetical protein